MHNVFSLNYNTRLCIWPHVCHQCKKYMNPLVFMPNECRKGPHTNNPSRLSTDLHCALFSTVEAMTCKTEEQKSSEVAR